MQQILDRYESGILISKVTMQNVQPPKQVQDAFDDAVKAGQDRDRQKNEGEAYANDVIPRARGEAARMLAEANGYQQQVIAAAEGDAARFRQIQSEYAKAPEVTRQRLYLETMQQIFAKTTKVLIDAKGNGNLLYLPLDKLMQAGAGIPAGTAGDAPSRAAPPLVLDAQSAERPAAAPGSLNRERGSRP
jgi:membrane protease subunit HflK